MVLKGEPKLVRLQLLTMRPASKSDAADSDPAVADFLRRLSVADAKVLLERTRKEKEAKTKEMQKMIGVRYRDLIDSADKIVTMHSAAMRLETSLKEMPDKWQQMETTLVATLAGSDKFAADASSEQPCDHETKSDAVTSFPLVHERVLFIVTSHEQLWFHLDRGECKQALALYQQAKQLFESNEVQDALKTYPFLPSMWSSVHSFENRVNGAAEMCLASRGKSATFYAGNLEALFELGRAQNIEELLGKFLRSRSRWLQLERTETGEDEDALDLVASAQRDMRLNLRSLLVTVLHIEEIFLSDSTLASSLRALRSGVVEQSPSAAILVEDWFKTTLAKVIAHASSIIDQIPTIATIAQTQAKLAKIETHYAAYRQTSVWKTLQSTHSAPGSMFELLFGKALRKRTRDLVQHSFVDATSAINQEIRVCLSVMTESADLIRQLPCIKFYEHFDSIHKKVAGLDSSELQRVLTEEYMRSLVGIVRFLEEEYPWVETRAQASVNPTFLLGLANILISIVTHFPERKKTLFGDVESENSTGRSLSDDVKVFESCSQDGKLAKQALTDALEDVRGVCGSRSSFIDEEIHQIDSAGFYTFRLLGQIKAGVPHPTVFVGILLGLAEKYCEAWARHLLQQKIAPLRDFLHVEQYDLTNEEWLSTHQGWSEQVIIADELSGDDEDHDGDSPTSTDEKVWLPWCETPTVSSFLFSCCYALDEAYRLVRTASGVSSTHVSSMHELIRLVLTEQLTIMSVDVYEAAVDLVVHAKRAQTRAVLNFGEYCMLQFLFDMYYVRATLGFSDFVRFGWGDEIDLETCPPSVARLKKLFERMHDFVDPVDWEIYGPQLIENVVVQFRKSRLLFSSLSEANDISEINGKPIVVSAQDTRPIVKLAEPVPRFSLLPVPSTRRRPPSVHASTPVASGSRSAAANGDSLFQEDTVAPTLPSLMLPNLLAGTTAGSNILSAATSGTNLLSSAAKGMSFLSSATSSYLRDGADAGRTKYF